MNMGQMTNSYQVAGCEVSVQPPGKNTASLSGNKFFQCSFTLGVIKKNEHRTLNIERPTSNNVFCQFKKTEQCNSTLKIRIG